MTADERLLELIGDVGGMLDLDEYRRGLIVALRRAVPSDWVSINEVGPEPGDHWELVEPELPASAHELFGRLMHQNPLVAHMTAGPRPGAPVRFSDVTTTREFHALEIYTELYGPLGLEHQIAFTLPQEPPRLLGVALSRRDRDYSDDERRLLTRARPFLVQSYRAAVAHDRVRREGGRAAMIAALQAAGLTPREAECVAQVARGASSAATAETLGVGVRTVDKHLQHVFAKLGVENRSQAAALAWEIVNRHP
ncbi:MAG TPA: helix-turn-helix transcriptional regulator [Solirubrobacterales bacterium]|nr:helix-turn-helix transcriptional regulator [Solirubrobacterales bacterium]